MVELVKAAKGANLIDFSCWAIDFGSKDSALDFDSSLKYNIKNILFYSCGLDFNAGLMTKSNFENVLQGIKASKLSKSLKRISVLDIGIEDDELDEMMNKYGLDHIMLTKDY